MSGAGARSIGVGGAYTALSSDVWSIFWNSAGLLETSNQQIGLMHSERFDGVIDFDALAISLPQKDGSVIAGGIIRLGINGIPYTRLSNSLEDDPSNSNRIEVYDVASSGEYAFYLSKAQFYRNWRIGITPKLILKHIGSNQGYGLGLDIGAKIRNILGLPIESGLIIRDFLGTPINWDTGHKEVILSKIRWGLAGKFDINPLEAKITPTFDLSYKVEDFNNSDAFSVHYGLEYLIREMISLRIGNDDDRLSFGGGVMLSVLAVDYAYFGHDDLGDTHRVSLTIKKRIKGD